MGLLASHFRSGWPGLTASARPGRLNDVVNLELRAANRGAKFTIKQVGLAVVAVAVLLVLPVAFGAGPQLYC